jgi:hypothetical protein
MANLRALSVSAGVTLMIHCLGETANAAALRNASLFIIMGIFLFPVPF